MERSVEESMAGCTANVVLITETEIYCANAGDSRAIIKIGSVK
jgi:serine/threonine protein phosphatase PrpC